MKHNLENMKFDTKIEPSDWRFSATIVGLSRYFRHFNIDFDIEQDCILYNKEDITKERYLEFAESFYGAEVFHHVVVENILKTSGELSDDQKKLLKEKFKKASLKKYFEKTNVEQINEELRDSILETINENRQEIIDKNFTNKYNKYYTSKYFFKEKTKVCRLNGYYVDDDRKTKSISYNFDDKNFMFHDIQEFDFILFAFVGRGTTFFINDNFDVKQLIDTNNYFKNAINENDKGEKPLNSRQVLFRAIIESSDFIDCDTEVIFKDEFDDKRVKIQETLYIRKDAIKILKQLKDNYTSLCRAHKIADNYYLDIQQEATNNIINYTLCDKLIETLLKEISFYWTIQTLIKVNVLIKGDDKMTMSMKIAYATAKEVATRLEENKLNGYRQKLISAVTFKDYDRAMLVLLNLSAYSDVKFNFANDLFANFEENKELIYIFINNLTKNTNNLKTESEVK